jgi:hypothetical protein
MLNRLFFLFLLVGFSLGAEEPPVLQAIIGFTPVYPNEANTLQPGMPTYLKATVKNAGGESRPEGELFIRFTLPQPLAKLGRGVNFETEKVPLPALKTGQEIEISFKTLQQLPNMADFLKMDWPKHIYQTIVCFEGQEFVIGIGTITFSAHYYAGPNKPLPTSLPSLSL